MDENILDLHRVKHEEAEILIDRFINKLWDKNIRAQIITGNSKGMKNIVINKLEFYKLDYKIGDYWDPNNKGYISVII
jgi:DNA-nicking Smr family endonuclease